MATSSGILDFETVVASLVPVLTCLMSWQLMSSRLVHIHAEAYIFTLQNNQYALNHRGADSRIPVNTRSGQPSSHSFRGEAIRLEKGDVPRSQTCRAQEDFTSVLESAIQGLNLGLSLGIFRFEPVHAVHDLTPGY